MDLHARLDAYEVTALPGRRPALQLVWCDAEADELAESSSAATPALALLDDYRITRVPTARRAAS